MRESGGGRPPSAQSHQRLNGSQTLQGMQTDLLRRTYRGITSQSDESFTGLDAHQRAMMPYTSTSHYLREVHGLEKPKSSDPPPSGCLTSYNLRQQPSTLILASCSLLNAASVLL